MHFDSDDVTDVVAKVFAFKLKQGKVFLVESYNWTEIFRIFSHKHDE